jgi:hypothetical protein
VIKDCPQAMRCGQVRDTSYEEVELALFLLARSIELHSMVAKGQEKGSNFSPPTKDHHSFLPLR